MIISDQLVNEIECWATPAERNLIETLRAKEAENQRLRDDLQEARDWIAYLMHYAPTCPSCVAYSRTSPQRHSDDCELAKALAQEGDELK